MRRRRIITAIRHSTKRPLSSECAICARSPRLYPTRGLRKVENVVPFAGTAATAARSPAPPCGSDIVLAISDDNLAIAWGPRLPHAETARTVEAWAWCTAAKRYFEPVRCMWRISPASSGGPANKFQSPADGVYCPSSTHVFASTACRRLELGRTAARVLGRRLIVRRVVGSVACSCCGHWQVPSEALKAIRGAATRAGSSVSSARGCGKREYGYPS